MPKLIATWHPTYAMFRNPYSWGEFRIDLDRFSRAIKGKLRPGPSKFILRPTVEDVAKVATHGYVTVDVESAPRGRHEPWTAKDPDRARLRCIGLGNRNWGLSFLWTEKSSPVADAIRGLLLDPKIKKVGHNAIWYDWPLLKRYNFHAKNIADTRDARRALSSTSRLGLKYLATLYDDPIPWSEEEEDEEKVIFTDNITDLLTYNIYDCVEDARLWDGIKAEKEWKSELVQRLYKIHLATSKLFAEVRHRGMHIDAKERKRLAKLLQDTYEVRKAQLLEKVGIEAFTCTPNSMRSLIFERHATTEISRFNLEDPLDKKMWNADGDSIKVDQDSLMLLYVDPGVPQDLKDIIDMYWAAQAAQKARSTFVTSDKITHAIGDDGFLRPGWNSCGADTGRISCNSPNVMTLPKDTDESSTRGELPNLRRMYDAEPGFKLIEADWKQQELHVRGLVAEDEVLLEALKGDVYTEDAKGVFKLPPHVKRCKCEGECIDPYDPKTKKGTHLKNKARQSAKTGHLGFAYGASTPTLYMQFLETDRTVRYSTVETVHHGLKERYHRTVSFWTEEQERVRRLGYSEDRLLGRRRYYPREPPITEIANYPIQATAAAITTLAELDLDRLIKKEIRKGGIIGQFHDALLIKVPDRDRDIRMGMNLLKEAMEQKFTIAGRPYVFLTDIKVGYNWADLEEVK